MSFNQAILKDAVEICLIIFSTDSPNRYFPALARRAYLTAQAEGRLVRKAKKKSLGDNPQFCFKTRETLLNPSGEKGALASRVGLLKDAKDMEKNIAGTRIVLKDDSSRHLTVHLIRS